ncbi:MAG: acyl-CoA dehydrogenase family protein [Gammaproteobacteria bacterium]
MNYNEPDHIRMLRETLQKFVENEMPRELAREWDQANEYPAEVFAKLADLGVTGMTMDEAHGGSGRDIQATMVVIEELSKRSMAIAVPYIMCTCYAGMNLVECASPEQQAELLPRVASGELLFAYGLTEPDVGADLASVRTTVVRDGDELVINGSKRFCSGAEISDYIYTLVCSDKEGERYRNLSFVMIPPDSAGVTIERIATMGMHGAATTDVTFSNVRVPIDKLMGGEAGWNNGWKMLAGPGLDVEKLEVAAIAVGVAAAAVEDAWEYSQERQQFGKPICTYQSIRHKLADMQTKLHAARLMMAHATELVQQGQAAGVETSMTKMFCTETAKELALECQTIMGAYGYVKEFDCERYVREAIVLPIFGGSTAIHLNNISNWMGLPKQ